MLMFSSSSSASSPPSFTVALIGRPNAGKSTLFNRLVGRRTALVHDRPGVTRDRREGNGGIADLSFRVIDTAGLEESDDDGIEGLMRIQTEQAVKEADVALFLIDARVGVTPIDEYFSDLLRKGNTPIVVVANKCEGQGSKSGIYDAYSLGFGDPIAVSAEHGQGLGDLYDALRPFSSEKDVDDYDKDDSNAEVLEGDLEEQPLQLAIVGRPNTGKSTLINRLIGKERMITGPDPGVTRDAVPVNWSFRNRKVRLVDTAGLRRKARVSDAVEKLSALDTLRAIDLAEVVVLVLEADTIFDKQDLTIASRVIEEGRALVIAVNKWDIATDKKGSLEKLRDKLDASLTQVRGVPTVKLSAKTGLNVKKLIETAFEIRGVWNRRVSTAALNEWLDQVTLSHPPPLSKQKRRIKIRYITQAKIRPPTFVAFTTRPVDLPESYNRYLLNSLRETFDFDGVPLRLLVRKPENPYVTDT